MTSDQAEVGTGRRRGIVVASVVAVVLVIVAAVIVAAATRDDGSGAAADPDEAGDEAPEAETTEVPEGEPDADEGEAVEEPGEPEEADEAVVDAPSLDGGLRELGPSDLRIGSAVAGGGHHAQQPYPDPFPNDEPYREVLAREFDSVTPENQLKWEFVHPRQGDYQLGPADDIVAFANEHGQHVRGHTLLWHSQNPSWLENGGFGPDELREILRDHIQTVVGHFQGRIHQWDVANEVFDDNAQLRVEENIWLRELGVEIIADAFRWAHEADPDALLFINDYNVEGLNAKSTAYHELVQELLADDVPIHGFGAQGHLSIEYGFPPGVEDNLRRFDELGLETAITEVDVRMAVPDSGPTPEQLERQADDYTRLLDACLNVAGCRSFTLWGFTDRYSWVPHFFASEGAATVMDDELRPRPAYLALRERLETGRPS